MATKRTYQPSKIKRKRKFGFRNEDRKSVIKSRRKKGRARLSVA